MTKPNIALARFADTGSANVTDPPSGSRDTGFVAGDPADEGVMNALLLQAYQWFQYLDDGALEGNHSIDGDLEVTGDLTGTITLAGDTDAVGPFTLLGVVKLAGTISPAALSTGNVNDYSPTGLSTANVIRVTPAAGSILTGLDGGLIGRLITLFNIGTDDLTVTHNDSASTAGKRFLLANGASLVIRDNGSVTFWYDDTSLAWRVLSQNL